MAFGIATGFGLQEYLVAQLEQAFIGREDVLAFLLEFSESLLETTGRDHGGCGSWDSFLHRDEGPWPY
jgi:hypothetical protein